MNTTNNQLISCVVPVYNVEKYLSSCIDSILSQVYKSLEIILVDDGSTDDSGRICDEYKLKNENIVVIHQCNRGLSEARNIGISSAKGEFITFIDSDDIVHPLCFQLMLNTLLESKADICISPLLSFSDAKEHKILSQNFEKRNPCKDAILFSPGLAIKEMLFEGRFDISACGKLYRTELFKDIQFPKEKLFEDLATTYKVIAKASTVVFIPYRFYGYRKRRGSITHSPFHESMMEILLICDDISDFAKKNCPDCSKAIAYRRAKASTILLERIIMSKSTRANYEIARKLKRNIRADLPNVLLNGNVQLLQKIKMVSGAYSKFMLKLVCKFYAVLFYMHERLR